MTYLQLINAVLRRLREDTVSNYNDTEYSTLIGDFVNEVKREVEDSWNWSNLRSTIQIATSSGTFKYTLTNAGDRYKILQVLDDTNDYELFPAPWDTLNKWFTITNSTNNQPSWYGINGQDSNSDPYVDLFPTPNGAYTINFNMVIAQDDLAANATKLTVPDYPVILGTYARALSERGEDGGTMYAEAMNQYYKALSDAIAMDSHNCKEETVWSVV